MLHFEVFPPALWFVLGLILAVIGIWRLRRSLQEKHLRARRSANHRRNVAHYKAWQWLIGTPKPRQLTDRRRDG